MKNKCIDCNKIISKKSFRCKSCAKKGRLNGRYIDGRKFAIYYCIEKNCNNIVSWEGRKCNSCSSKLSHKLGLMKNFSLSQKGKHPSKKTREKISQALSGEKHYNYIDGRKNKKVYCIDCKKKISWNSKRCKSCTQKRKLNSNYINGISRLPYTLEWTKDLKEEIRKRDNYACKLCNITEEEHISIIGCLLSIHHIDYDKQNCNESNLVTLCKQCNSRVNFNREYWKNYFKNLLASIKLKEN